MALFWCLFGLSRQALADGTPYSITLTWDANTEPDITGYILRYGTATGVYTNTIDVGNTTTLIIPDLATDTTVIYFVVSGYNTADLEGPQSLETNTNPSDTAVTSIALSYGQLIPDLAAGIDAYIAYVPFNATSIVVTPQSAGRRGNRDLNGTNVDPGSASGSIMIKATTAHHDHDGGAISSASESARQSSPACRCPTLLKNFTAISRGSLMQPWEAVLPGRGMGPACMPTPSSLRRM